MWNEERQEYTRKVRWGIGSGWILTGLMRLYREVKAKEPEEAERLHQRLHRLLEKMMECVGEENLLHDILDDKDSFCESESSAMLAYVIYSLAGEESLPPAYLEKADRIRQALRERVTPEGVVTWASSSPEFLYPGTSVECQAHFLMMEAAREKLKKREDI